MTNYSPFTGRRPVTQAPMVLVRTLWTMRSGGREIRADVFKVLTGRELRITLGADLLESRLTRADDADLDRRAAAIRAVLAGRGWRDEPLERKTAPTVDVE